MTRLVLGTRGSALALAQANWVRDTLLARGAAETIDLEIIHTRGDKILDVPLAKVGGKGLFVKEIELALLDGRIDLAVHSLKDMPVEQPEGLVLAAFPEREDPRDCLIFRGPQVSDAGSPALAEGARVGTSSLRRGAQIQSIFPGIEVVSIRGNVGTRLGLLTEEDGPELDAIILAQAGLNRLNIAPDYFQILSPDLFLPAVGQGVLAIECREGDLETQNALAQLDHASTRVCVLAERAFLKAVEGSCQVPVAAHARVLGDEVELEALISSLDGVDVLKASKKGSLTDAIPIGAELGAELMARGGDRLLQACLLSSEK